MPAICAECGGTFDGVGPGPDWGHDSLACRRVTIQGQVFVRHDVGSPEHELSTARTTIAELTTRVDVLEAALREQDRQFAGLVVVLDKAHALLSSVAGAVRDGEQRLPVGIHAEGGGIARYLTAAFVRRCADWCDGEYSPGENVQHVE